jgi:hypothetical protein
MGGMTCFLCGIKNHNRDCPKQGLSKMYMGFQMLTSTLTTAISTKCLPEIQTIFQGELSPAGGERDYNKCLT